MSTDGGDYPGWSPDGQELFYRAGLNFGPLMRVTVETEPTFSAGIPEVVIAGDYIRAFQAAGLGRNWDIFLDGQRFLMLKNADQAQNARSQIHVVLNWTEELTRLFPDP